MRTVFQNSMQRVSQHNLQNDLQKSLHSNLFSHYLCGEIFRRLTLLNLWQQWLEIFLLATVFPQLHLVPKGVPIRLEVQFALHQCLNRASAELVSRGSAEPLSAMRSSHPLVFSSYRTLSRMLPKVAVADLTKRFSNQRKKIS